MYGLALRSARSAPSRIPCARPLRPPSRFRARIFSSKAPSAGLQNAPRTQLAFLSPSGVLRNGPLAVRPLSTESREVMRYRLHLIRFWGVNLLVVVGMYFSLSWLFHQRKLSLLYPHPHEWGVISGAGLYFREANDEWAKEAEGFDLTDWAKVGGLFRKVFEELESTEPKVKLNEDWDNNIPGIDREFVKHEPYTEVHKLSRIGMDISGWPEPWRRAYVQALMGYARATEMDAGWVVDTKRRLSFPKNQVIGPSNPYPHPVWPGSPPAPHENDCVPAFDDPSTVYIRILTTKGLTPAQQLEAGLAYASWVDYEGDKATASQLYKWSLDLACSALAQEGTDPNVIVDRRTGVIKPNAPFVTPNILRAATALASYRARDREVSAALPIYLSVLRARRTAPDAPRNKQYKQQGMDLSLNSAESIWPFLRSINVVPSMPPVPSSGNEPFERTQGSSCDEAGIMAHVGEILFATSSKRDGLAWTRAAVDQAEKGVNDRRLDNDSKQVCIECMSTGLDNWSQMLSVLLEEGKKRKPTSSDGTQSESNSWSSWLPSFAKGETANLVDEGDWEQEADRVGKKRSAFLEHRLMMSMNRKVHAAAVVD